MLLDLTPDILPPRAALLADDVMLLAVEESDCAVASRIAPRPPFGTVSVSGPAGQHLIAAMRASRYDTDEKFGQLLLDEPITLADELDLMSRRRLLGFLLGFCRSAFNLANDPGFAKICIQLARRCAEVAGTVEPLAQATPFWMVLPGLPIPDDATLYVLSAAGIRHSAPPRSPDPRMRFAEPLADGDLLLAFSATPKLWAVRRGPGPLIDVLAPAARDSRHRALRTPCLRALATLGGPTAALLREMQVLQPAAPKRLDDPTAPLGAGLDMALLDGDGGLFLRGWLRDPLDLLAGLELRADGATAPVSLEQTHHFARPDLAKRFAKSAFGGSDLRLGFIAHLTDPSGGLCAQPSLALRLRSGNLVEVRAPVRHLPAAAARDAVLSAVPPEAVTPTVLDDCLAPAAASLHRQALSGHRGGELVQIGVPVRRPAVSILLPLYRNLGFLRFQAAAFAADAECRRAELVVVLDSPEQRAEVEHLLRGLHGLHGLAFTLLILPRNLGYAAANNEAARVARGATLLLLNSDVVPTRPGWLQYLRDALASPGVAAAGPKLLFDDGSIQHAGLFFERDADGVWFNAHYHKGKPRLWSAAQRRRRVPGVTGAALLVRRAAFEAVGGMCEDYIIGDYEDSDFCLRLRAAGGSVAYVPEAELYHFERRSIRLHAGYARSVACLYNRRLHHRRWDGTMQALMHRREYRSAA